MIPSHYSRDIVTRCHSLLTHLLPIVERGLSDDYKFGGPLNTTLVLALATPMLVLPLERIYSAGRYPERVGDDRQIDPFLASSVAATLGGDKRFGDTPFGRDTNWAYVPSYAPVFNLADGIPDDLLHRLATREAADRARYESTGVILRVLRNGLAHGGVAYLDKHGMTSADEAAMFAFLATAKDDRRRVVGLNVVRVTREEFTYFSHGGPTGLLGPASQNRSIGMSRVDSAEPAHQPQVLGERTPCRID
jgi:hypothetical protein